MGDHERLIELSDALAAAIARRDVAAIRPLLAGGFVHRTPGGTAVETDAFLSGIAQIPGEILSVTVRHLTTDLSGDGAVVTGTQYANLRIDNQLVVDERSFVDWFVKDNGEWRLRLAVDLE